MTNEIWLMCNRNEKIAEYSNPAVMISGTFFGIAVGLLVAVTLHQPSWLNEPDYLNRAIAITIATFILISMGRISLNEARS